MYDGEDDNKYKGVQCFARVVQKTLQVKSEFQAFDWFHLQIYGYVTNITCAINNVENIITSYPAQIWTMFYNISLQQTVSKRSLSNMLWKIVTIKNVTFLFWK